MVDVLIVGAGPVGLFLALQLRRQGLEVAVIDRRTSVVFDPRAAVIWPRVAEVLVGAGLGPSFARERGLLEGVELQVRGARRGTLRLGGLDGPEPLAWILEQHRTEALLREALDVPVRGGHTLTGLTQDAAGVTATVREGERELQLRARYLVGADGAHSTVRKLLGIAFEGAAHEGLECLQVNAECRFRRPLTPGYCRFDLAPDVTLLSVQLPSGGYRFVSFSRARGALTQPTLEEAQAQLSHVTKEPLALTLTEPRWLTRARFQDRLAARLRDGRVLLCGDAAAVWAPIGGRGMNVGLLSAQGLAWRLGAVVRGEADASVLDAYGAEVRAAVRRVLRTLRWNRLEYPSSGLPLRLIDLALRTSAASERVPRPIERVLSLYGLDARGPVVSRVLVPDAGRRLPDALLDGGVRVHERLASGAFTVLGVGCAPPALPGIRAHEVPLLDVGGARWFGARPCLVLVRPDGLIAARVGPHQGPRLAAALRRSGGAPLRLDAGDEGLGAPAR